MLLAAVALVLPIFLGFRLAAETKKNEQLRLRVEQLEAENRTDQLTTEEVYAALRELHPELPATPEVSLVRVTKLPPLEASTLAARLSVIDRLPPHGASQIGRLKDLARELIASGQYPEATQVIDRLPRHGVSYVRMLKELESAIARS